MRTNKTLIMASALLCLQAASARAEYRLGSWQLTGSALLGGYLVSGNSEEHAEFNKYRDITDGPFGDLSITSDSGSYQMRFDARDIARDDQEYRLSGQNFGSFDYQLWYNEIINRKDTVGVKGPWNGAGSDNLTIAPEAVLNTANPTGTGFREFDYEVKRKDFGVELNLLKNSPFFVMVGYDQELQDGIRAMSVNQTINTGAAFTVQSLPEPIDYTTHNARINVGYRNDAYSVSADSLVSAFGNNNDRLTWTPTFGGTDVTMLAQDNMYWNSNLKGTLYNLAMDSTLSAKVGYSRITSDFDLLRTGFLDGANQGALTTVNTPATESTSFDGLIEYTTANLAVASSPLNWVDTRIHYTFLDKANSSPLVTYTLNDGPHTGKAFGYTKHNAGLDTSYELGFNTELDLDYEFEFRSRDRDDLRINRDHVARAELANTSLGGMTVRVKYAHLWRFADLGTSEMYTATTGYMPYDYAPQRRDTAGVELEFAPMERMDLGIEYEYSIAKFPDTTRGVTDAKSHIASATLGYQFGERLHASLYGNVEKAMTDVFLTSTGANLLAANFDDEYWTAGTVLTVPVITDKIDLTGGYQYHRGNGLWEYTTRTGTSATLASIPNLDDYTKHAVDVRMNYKFIKNLSAKLGYIFEDLSYNSRHINGYQYYPRVDADTGQIYTGAEGDKTYKTHVAILAAEYTF